MPQFITQTFVFLRSKHLALCKIKFNDTHSGIRLSRYRGVKAQKIDPHTDIHDTSLMILKIFQNAKSKVQKTQTPARRRELKFKSKIQIQKSIISRGGEHGHPRATCCPTNRQDGRACYHSRKHTECLHSRSGRGE